MAAEALKQDVRAWVSEGGSLTQATEHPSGLCEPDDTPVASPTPKRRCKVRAKSCVAAADFLLDASDC
jgi:hypothetical protein